MMLHTDLECNRLLAGSKMPSETICAAHKSKEKSAAFKIRKDCCLKNLKNLLLAKYKQIGPLTDLHTAYKKFAFRNERMEILMEKLKVAVIGCGGIAQIVHVPALIANKAVEIAAFCDAKIDKAKELAAKYGVEQIFADYKEVLELSEVDAVHICTANYLHSIIAIAALKKGKHVFCEKPDAINVEEVMKMKQASEESGKVLMVMRNNRYRDEMRFLKRYFEEGNFGEIYTAKCGFVRRRGTPGRGGWFTTKELSGGGPLIDLGVHMIDVCMWIMGNPRPAAVVGSTYCMFADNAGRADSASETFRVVKVGGIFDVEDLATGFIRFENGASLHIEFSWASNIEKENSYIELLGTKAGARLHDDGRGLMVFGETNGTLTDLHPVFGVTELTKPHTANIHHFVDCVLHGVKPDFTPQQGVDMIKILTALYESAETRREVLL